jgi:hypothetical protein
MMKILTMKRIKKKFWTYLILPCSLLLAQSELVNKGEYEKEDLIFIENSQRADYEKLPSSQKGVFNQLGPLYQKIYLYALNDEERARVVIYIQRGVNPYEAINVILRAEERKYARRKQNQSISPSQRGEAKSSSSSLF